jgi:hypothetical protein
MKTKMLDLKWTRIARVARFFLLLLPGGIPIFLVVTWLAGRGEVK